MEKACDDTTDAPATAPAPTDAEWAKEREWFPVYTRLCKSSWPIRETSEATGIGNNTRSVDRVTILYGAWPYFAGEVICLVPMDDKNQVRVDSIRVPPDAKKWTYRETLDHWVKCVGDYAAWQAGNKHEDSRMTFEYLRPLALVPMDGDRYHLFMLLNVETPREPKMDAFCSPPKGILRRLMPTRFVGIDIDNIIMSSTDAPPIKPVQVWDTHRVRRLVPGVDSFTTYAVEIDIDGSVKEIPFDGPALGKCIQELKQPI